MTNRLRAITLCCVVLFIIPFSSLAFLKTDEILLKKNFYLLYLLEEKKIRFNGTVFLEVRNRLYNDARSLQCSDALCYSNALQFKPEEIQSIGDELVRLTGVDKRVSKLISALRKSHAYHLYDAESDTGFIRKVWQADANGIAYILNTYIAGAAPLYPKIDAISFEKDSPELLQQINAHVQKITAAEHPAFYHIPLMMALEALRINGRDEAARYEPLTGGENAAAYKRAKKINWQQYAYTAILVPGRGPEEPGVRLHPDAVRRCDSAVIRFREGKAPFLILSGGHVHPNKTPYCEAIEMKKYLVEVQHIPADAIIIEPHARHTTTNLRNATRLVYHFNMPMDKPLLIVTDASQNGYINGNMGNKVLKELGYLPYASITKLSNNETAFVPSFTSLQINSQDPLDP
jgi:hypothetical protein